ncbi:kinase-like protein [Moesziomyces antarcticus]|uniref:non-specific serine/threonine protein kinase n=2 Tax=Pseudozyma antarctica TaxID=84753 RepID=A0A081CG44_PSEA2|nr:kinase-like protein [Moesziomyces antarcticus]GAK65640.1 kinase-like protein [Moesziomyces antarcticus]SPO46657.1 probable protein kinase DBF2 [Moesziomyces antarcticus]
MAPAQTAVVATTSVPSPLATSKKENTSSQPSLINDHIKPPKHTELSRINENNSDSQPDPKGSWRSWRRGDGLQPWETEIVRSTEVQRKANVAQLYFLNYYFDNLRYLADRKARLTRFHDSTRARGLLPDHDDAEASPEFIKERSSYFGRERVLLRKRRTKLRVNQFHIITQVGAGGYGEVFLARKRDTGEICALKRLKKRILVKMDEVRHVLTERDILTATKTPWLVRLLYAFQDPDHVFLAMEYVPGGDFRTLLCNNGALKEEYARFYMAEMIVSVNELHRLGYIHRDLKPENFLVDSTGHVKLTDFGLASGALHPGKIESMKAKLDAVKDSDFVYRTPAERGSMYKKMIQHTQHRANSIVGSPDYIAPEMLRGRQYSFGVDYWSLGCILYEFLCGFPPFSGSNPDETFANLKNWQKVLQRPVYDTPENMQFNLSDVAWDAITKLVDTPERRYSSLEPVQAHPFFRSLDLGRLRELKAPFIPELENEEDTGYFDNFEDPADMARYKDVHEKQKNVEAVRETGSGAGGRGMWAGFTFGKNGVGANGQPLYASSTVKDATDAFATMF